MLRAAGIVDIVVAGTSVAIVVRVTVPMAGIAALADIARIATIAVVGSIAAIAAMIEPGTTVVTAGGKSARWHLSTTPPIPRWGRHAIVWLPGSNPYPPAV